MGSAKTKRVTFHSSNFSNREPCNLKKNNQLEKFLRWFHCKVKLGILLH
jgi:hypothetical protein